MVKYIDEKFQLFVFVRVLFSEVKQRDEAICNFRVYENAMHVTGLD